MGAQDLAAQVADPDPEIGLAAVAALRRLLIGLATPTAPTADVCSSWRRRTTSASA